MRMRWLWISSILYWISLYATVATISVQAERVAQFALFGVGIMLGLFGVGLLLTRILIGLLASRSNRKLLFVGGLIIVLLGNLIVPALPHPAILFASRFLLGVGAGFWVILSVLYIDHQLDKPRATSHITLTYALGITAGGLGGGVLANIWGWYAPFWTGTVTAFLAIATLMPIRDVVKSPPPLSLGEFLRLTRQPQLLIVSVLGALVFFVGSSTVWGFTPNFAVELGANPLWLGIISFAMLAPYAVSIRMAHIVRRVIGAKSTIAGGLAVAGTATLFIPFVGNVAMLSLLHIGVGAGLGAVYSTLMWLAIEDTSYKNESMGIFQTIYAAGFLFGPPLTGIVVDSLTLEVAFFFNGSLAIIAFMAIAALAILRGFAARLPRLE